MSLIDLWYRITGQSRIVRRHRGVLTPFTLATELGNPQLNRPIVFDPALRQLTAHRAGEPRFESDDAGRLWYSCRTKVLHHILTLISNSPSQQNLLLRGSAVMASWFGDRARRPGDLDWVVLPERLSIVSTESLRLIETVTDAIAGVTIDEHLKISDGAFAMEEIWTYEKAPGVRMIVPWQHEDAKYNGTVQMDFVFGEKLASPPVQTTVVLGEMPPIPMLTASPEQSLAWKLMWLTSDAYSIGKDLYDAVLLAEAYPISAALVRATFMTDKYADSIYQEGFDRKTFLTMDVEWDDFLKEYPEISGTDVEWKERLANALQPLFIQLGTQRDT